MHSTLNQNGSYVVVNHGEDTRGRPNIYLAEVRLEGEPLTPTICLEFPRDQANTLPFVTDPTSVAPVLGALLHKAGGKVVDC